MTYTVEQVQAFTMRMRAHYDGPRGRDGWFGDMFGCDQEPRLAVLHKCFRANRSVIPIYYVDGVEIGSELAAAVAKLNADVPTLTAEETIAVQKVTDQWQDLRGSFGNMGMAPLQGLRDKGVIEFQNGKCRMRSEARWRLHDGALKP